MSSPPTDDPFGTEELRAATLQAWRRSPTRLREDTATEADLVRGGYRDRVLTELAQNAADAAARAGVQGQLTVRLVRDELRVANTGAPLDRGGVQALAALRASTKRGGVGRYGVGFTAVLTVSEEPRVLSRSGSVVFSAARTRAELDSADSQVPVLRLVWAVDEQPPVDASTEVVLPLRPGIDGAALLADFAVQVPELLLALPALQAITVDGTCVERSERVLDSGLEELVIGEQRWWCSGDAGLRWLVRVDATGQVLPLDGDVLRAPTATDEELSLPALLIVDVALQPDRRRLLPGTSLTHAAQAYPALVSALPAEQRSRLVPLPGFPRSAVDAALREDVLAALRDARWLPAAHGAELAPRAAQVLDVASPELVELLAELLPGLVSAELASPAHSAALVALGVPRLGLASLAETLAGIQREPEWWMRLYQALDPLVTDRRATEELAGLPVPLADGRTVLGPRSTVLAEVGLMVPGVRVVHPDAAHPLLLRLGAARAGAGELLDNVLLREAVHEADPDDPRAATELASAVFALVAAAGIRPGEHSWLGELLLPDTEDELRAADELLLPGAPLQEVLVADAPFGTVAGGIVAEHGSELLRAVGVGWGFTVVTDEDATAPEHELDGEEQWWAEARPEPSRVLAVRDLDLVDPERWAQALTVLCSEPDTLAAVRQHGGYTAWWLRRYARLDGVVLGHWRHEEDAAFAGLLDSVPVAGLPAELLARPGVDSVDLATLLLERLGDSARTPSAAVATRTYAALAGAVVSGGLELEELDPPERVRTLSGRVVDSSAAAVLDHRWLTQVLAETTLVVGDLREDAASALAELLDLPLASEQADGVVSSSGEPVAWAELGEVVLACGQLGVLVPEGVVVRHAALTVRVEETEHSVDWWIDAESMPHAGPGGLLPALLEVLPR